MYEKGLNVAIVKDRLVGATVKVKRENYSNLPFCCHCMHKVVILIFFF